MSFLRRFRKETYDVECGRCHHALLVDRKEVEAKQFTCPDCGHVSPIPDCIQQEYTDRRTKELQKQQEERDKKKPKEAVQEQRHMQEEAVRRDTEEQKRKYAEQRPKYTPEPQPQQHEREKQLARGYEIIAGQHFRAQAAAGCLAVVWLVLAILAAVAAVPWSMAVSSSADVARAMAWEEAAAAQRFGLNVAAVPPPEDRSAEVFLLCAGTAIVGFTFWCVLRLLGDLLEQRGRHA